MQRYPSTLLCNSDTLLLTTKRAHHTPPTLPQPHTTPHRQATKHIAPYTIPQSTPSTTQYATPQTTTHHATPHTTHHTPHSSKLLALLGSWKPSLSERQTLSQDLCVPMKQLAVWLLAPLAACTPLAASDPSTSQKVSRISVLVHASLSFPSPQVLAAGKGKHQPMINVSNLHTHTRGIETRWCSDAVCV